MSCEARKPNAGLFSLMASIRPCKTARVSSWDRTGGNDDFISFKPGETKVLAELRGPGIIRHFWGTRLSRRDPLNYRKGVLRMFWDGEDTPSVEVPWGDFFGVGFCMPKPFQSLPVVVNEGRKGWESYGFGCYFPMPFAESARIEIENQSDADLENLWYHIEYERLDSLPADLGRFHAQWRRQNPCKAVPPEVSGGVNLTGEDNYAILEAEGRGNYAGFFLNVDNAQGGWYGEGDDMIFIDGEKWPPSIHGTGTEEIFGGGAGPNHPYFGPYTGFHLVSSPDYSGKQSMYRFHVQDPVAFQKSICVTLEHGHANDYANDYSSTAFWYQVEPHAPFPKLPPVEERFPRFPDEFWHGYDILMEALRIMSGTEWREHMNLDELRALRRNAMRGLDSFMHQRWDDFTDAWVGSLAILHRKVLE